MKTNLLSLPTTLSAFLLLALAGCSGGGDATNCLSGSDAASLLQGMGITECAPNGNRLCGDPIVTDKAIDEEICAFYHNVSACGAQDSRGCNTLGKITGTVKSAANCGEYCYHENDITITDTRIPCSATPSERVPCVAPVSNPGTDL